MIDYKKPSETDLIEGLRVGDRDAFTIIYKEYWYRMFTVANRKLQNRELAEELIQDIFTRLWKERETIRITQLDFYLFSAVRYEVIDQIRAAGRQNTYAEYYKAFASFEDLNTENTVVFNDLVQMIDKGLEILPEKTREVFKLCRLQNWSLAKIASHLDLSEKAVEYHLTKATKSIRIYLKEVLISLLLLGISFWH
ncbi:RNA polymerase sigma factor [Dyadobacter subterraneus]|uniref:Sigma-70 family RNA polymerase sigma factor n=1 Tax=Dyadobacter subterraneus TaxID=2773304 RepID=A0ABR9WAB5_9BACT|nr:sigma-70 family RNA polymerase sigma factor [Dyadobacter subterraneus]MBE9462392.1 sigma-70 family RNA polymerase sigma factor [Dyadobacter subterraneus]